MQLKLERYDSIPGFGLTGKGNGNERGLTQPDFVRVMIYEQVCCALGLGLQHYTRPDHML